MPGWLTARFPKYSQDLLLLVVDLIGTFVFAVEGAVAGIDAGLDVFGLLVLSFVTALGGGTIRDLLIGAIPPNSIRDWRYGATAFAGGGAVFFFPPLGKTFAELRAQEKSQHSHRGKAFRRLLEVLD